MTQTYEYEITVRVRVRATSEQMARRASKELQLRPAPCAVFATDGDYSVSKRVKRVSVKAVETGARA